MSNKVKIHIGLSILIGLVFLIIGAYQWYDLYQVEQGLKQGQLPLVLLKIYEVAGKWGVAGFYSLFSIYCFWRANKISKQSKTHDLGEDN